MEDSNALICSTAGSKRFTARSLLVPKIFASKVLNKRVSFRKSWAEYDPWISLRDVNGWG
jgi:hypothetical protein